MAGATPDPESPEEAARICAEARRVVAARRRGGEQLALFTEAELIPAIVPWTERRTGPVDPAQAKREWQGEWSGEQH
jgi:hypothetical protein